ALKGFLIRAADDTLDNQSWLVPVATLLGGKPPEVWLDADVERSRINLQMVARRFKTLERMLYHEISRAMPPHARLVRMAVTRPGAPEHDSLVAVHREDEATVSALVRDLEERLGSQPTDLVLAALADIATSLIAGRDADSSREEAV